MSLCVNVYAYLIAMNHEVVSGNQGFENHYPAGIASSLYQRVGHLGDVHVSLVLGGLDQVCKELSMKNTQEMYGVF